jgi:hypothetical protein
MSNVEIEELSALGEWLSSFPQLEQFASDKENGSSLFDTDDGYASNFKLKGYVFFALIFVGLFHFYVLDHSLTFHLLYRHF